MVCLSNEPSKKEIKKILCIIASKRIKYLRINFIKAVKDLYTEKYKIKKAERQRIDAFELWCWKRLESTLDCKEIKPVNPKGDQS